MSDIVLKIENLSKQYRLGVMGSGTLRDDVSRWVAKIRGKEDPTLKIGETNSLDTVDGDYVWALKNINFEVKKGEVLGIIGKNGAGKSTLLKILSKVTGPTTGSIKSKGRIASLLEVGTGMHPELTGKENIFLNGAILGMTKAEVRKKIDEIIDFAGITKYVDTPIKRYSSGMRVRLGFAVAAFLEPEILIVDEVLAVGDAEFQKKAIGKMQDVSKGEGRTVLFVSHNMTSIKQLCTRVVLLKKGAICLIDTPENTISEYLKDTLLNKKRTLKLENTTKEDTPIIFKEVKIIANGSTVNPIDFNDEICIEILFVVHEKVVNVNLACVIKRLDTAVIISFDTDENEALLSKREKGEYLYKLFLPKATLGIGLYEVNISAGYMNHGTFTSIRDSLLLEIENMNNKIQYHSISRKPLVISPIKWKLNKLSND